MEKDARGSGQPTLWATYRGKGSPALARDPRTVSITQPLR